MTFEIRKKVPAATQAPGLCRRLSSLVCSEWLLKSQLIHKAGIKSSSKLCFALLLCSFLGSVLLLLSTRSTCATTSSVL